MKKQENSEFFLSEEDFDICSVLNDPHQKEYLEKPTIKDIPSVLLTPIPEYEISDFQPYLSKISKEYQRYCENKKNGVSSNLFDSEVNISKLNFNKHNEYSLSHSFISNNFELLKSDKDHISDVSLEKMSETMEISLSFVPSVYFKSNFELENSRIFDLVIDNSKIFTQNASSVECRDLSNNNILQEKLSWYLDIVEMHLIKEINKASSSFFIIIDYFQDLYKESSKCINKIKELRNKLINNSNILVKPRLRIIEIMEKKKKLDILSQVLKHIHDILYELSKIRNLIDENDYINALNMIEKINKRMKENIDGLNGVPLSKVIALSSVLKELEIYGENIKHKLSLQFTDELMKDHKQVITSISPDAIGKIYLDFQKRNWINKNINLYYINLSDDFRKRIKEIIVAIYMTDSVENVLKHYCDIVLKEVKNIITQNLLFYKNDESIDVDQLLNPMTKGYSTLINSLREMTPENFLQMIGTIYVIICLFVQKLLVYQKLLLDITSNLINESKFADKSKSLISIDISNILVTAIDITHFEIVKILDIRASQTSRLAKNDLFRFFTLHAIFLSQCEILTGKSGELLQRTVLSQVKESISNYHTEKISLETSILDKDQWVPEKKITKEFQNAIACIVESETTDPISWKREFLFNETENSNSCPDLTDTSDGNLKSFITIKDENYFVTKPLISLFLILQSYAEFLILIPPMAYDVSNNLLEILELYNFKVCQLILGAGATKTAGFKTITAKYLALASHSISLIISLIPSISEFVKRHLGTIYLSKFNELKNAYEEHQSQIHLKFISIISDRLNMLINSPVEGLKTLDWSKELPRAEDGTLRPHSYIEFLARDTLTLYKVLKKYLKYDTLQNVMTQILDMYVEILPKEFSSLPLEMENLKNHVLIDLKYFADNLTILGNIGEEAGYKILKNVESIFEKKGKTRIQK
ncbi:hypothetical protein PCANB_002493 [Pneumocystis canis]|nr:hypothetical protein PCK1_002464 [Pneumocystis canis]KAG5438773.1 hypothetical protein PCANB_002493 [Pneumocystis canis]